MFKFAVGESTSRQVDMSASTTEGSGSLINTLTHDPLNWWRGPAYVEHWSSADVLSLSYDRLVADG